VTVASKIEHLFPKTRISCISCRVTEIEKKKRIPNSEKKKSFFFFAVNFIVVRFSDTIQIGSIWKTNTFWHSWMWQNCFAKKIEQIWLSLRYKSCKSYRPSQHVSSLLLKKLYTLSYECYFSTAISRGQNGGKKEKQNGKLKNADLCKLTEGNDSGRTSIHQIGNSMLFNGEEPESTCTIFERKNSRPICNYVYCNTSNVSLNLEGVKQVTKV
jgi:hypothetical protein